MEEKRHTTLTEQDIDNIVEKLTEPENIDKFAKNFEQRWRDYFYKGLGKGIVGYAKKGIVLAIVGLSAYGMGKGWIWK